MGEYLQTFLEWTKLGIKVTFLAIPAAIIVFLASLGNGTLDYDSTKEQLISTYEVSTSILDTLNPADLIDDYKNWKETFFTEVKDTVVDVFDNSELVTAIISKIPRNPPATTAPTSEEETPVTE